MITITWQNRSAPANRNRKRKRSSTAADSKLTPLTAIVYGNTKGHIRSV
jgi:hypothetical protein